MKKPLLFLFLLVLGLISYNQTQAQVTMTLFTSPNPICLGQSTTTTVSLSGLAPGVTADTMYFDYNNDGTNEGFSRNNTFNYLYTTAGQYKLKVTVVLSNGTRIVDSSTVVRVNANPDPSQYSFNTAMVQCFRGNLIELENKAVTVPGGTPIKRMEIDWGDGNKTTNTNPAVGLKSRHSYSFSKDTFLVTVTYFDDGGCSASKVGYARDSFVTIKNNLQPTFNVLGQRGCFKSTWTLNNTTTGINFNAVNRYTWRFGDTTPAFTRSAPFNLPIDRYHFDSISHLYLMSGTFYPVLIIEDTTGCIDSLVLDDKTIGQKPENISFKFDMTPYFSKADTIRRADSACFGKPQESAISFKQTAIDFGSPGSGDFLWTFGDPPSLQLNEDKDNWFAPHVFTDTGRFEIILKVTITPCDTADTIYVDILGPKASIALPAAGIVIAPSSASQCIIQTPVEFPNTSVYYKSEHTWRNWSFGDDFAPKCTSFLLPNVGFPPPGGWVFGQTPPQQINNSVGFWIQYGQKYAGKRLDCNHSHDTLPVHSYTPWQLILSWHRDGHDFMPWDTTRYTRNPADTIATAPNKKFWVHDRDTALWGRPVYLNAQTGTLSLNPGPSVTDPVTGIVYQSPRVDTIGQNEPPANQFPQDLEPMNRIVINRGVPDPFELERGFYNITPRGTIADPKNQPAGFTYRLNGRVFTYPWNKKLPDSNLDIYDYIFMREIQRRHTVTLSMGDTFNHASNFNHVQYPDPDTLIIDSSDCNHEVTAQLSLVEPDARGLGKSEKECPGKFNPDGNGVKFRLDQVSGSLGNFPGVNPAGGLTYILLNHDSLADRLDNTPCDLDAFVDFAGGPTPGGLFRMPFSTAPDWASPPAIWTAPGGTETWYHYGPGTAVGPQQAPPPADPRGYVTVGLIIGSGSVPGSGQPVCITDTVWYHNFFFMRGMDAAFMLDPTYDPVTGVPTPEVCKQYCKNDEITFVYGDSTQDSVWYTIIDWGDNTFTVDTFTYGFDSTNTYYVQGIRRARATWFTSACGKPDRLLEYIPFPQGLPRVDVDTIWHENYYHMLTPGNLEIIGPNTAGDSLLISQCKDLIWIAMKDTLERWYYPEYRDKALMLLPVKHKFTTSSFDDGCKQPGISPTIVSHIMMSRKGCIATDFQGLIVRGVIDVAQSRDSLDRLDTVFCMGEPVHFYDSVRYWRPDCTRSNVDFNKNRCWNCNPQGELGSPFDAYHFDTADYWRIQTGNLDSRNPDGSFVEKMKWFFGDGDSASGVRPIHRYKKPGRYTVTMFTVDRHGCLDTAECVVYISEPIAKATMKSASLNCGQEAMFYNKSIVERISDTIRYKIRIDSVTFKDTFSVNIYAIDSSKTIWWWFGERTRDTLTVFDAKDIDTAIWTYRGNGFKRAKIVMATEQGCFDTSFINVNIKGPEPSFKVITDSIGCLPYKVRIVNTSDSVTAAMRISWGNGAISMTYDTYDTLEYIYYDTGTFYISAVGDDDISIDDTKNCRVVNYPDTIDGFQAPVSIRVLNSYAAQISVNTQTVCVDQPFTITNLSDTLSYLEFRYDIYKDDTITRIDSFIRSNTQNTIVTSISDSGRYFITLEPTVIAPGLPECKLYDTIEINVKQPVANFTTDTTNASLEGKFSFENQSVGASEFYWYAYNIQTPTVNKFESEKLLSDNNGNWDFDLDPTDTGDFMVCLVAYTPDPAKPICADTICDSVSYKFIQKFEIYNVFTPNGDGQNDVFDINIEGETEYDLVVYNRWGTKVFESKDKNKDWNGKNMNDGSECPQGTYFYVFKYKLRSGKEDTVNGSITLIK